MARNMIIWEGKNLNPECAMHSSSTQITQWRNAQIDKREGMNAGDKSHRQIVHKWAVPGEGQCKINVDASAKTGTSAFRIEMVLRNSLDGFCKARVSCYGGEVAVFEAEARGILEALNWAVNLGISSVVIESDSMLSVQAIERGDINLLEVGNVIQDCRCMLNDRPDFSVSFVRKQANQVACLIARVSCEVNCFHEFCSPPHSVLKNLLYDVTLS